MVGLGGHDLLKGQGRNDRLVGDDSNTLLLLRGGSGTDTADFSGAPASASASPTDKRSQRAGLYDSSTYGPYSRSI